MPHLRAVETRLTAEQFAQELYALLSLGGHAKLPNTFVAVVAAQVEAFRDKSEAGLRAKLAERSTLAVLDANTAFRQWERDTGKPASASERNAFGDGFEAAKAPRLTWMNRALAAEAEAAALRERERWIPVEEKLPENGAMVNVVIDGVVQHIPAQLTEDRWEWVIDADSAPKEAVTHWKALSAAPERLTMSTTDVG